MDLFVSRIISAAAVLTLMTWSTKALFGFLLGLMVMHVAYRCRHGTWFDLT